MAGRIRETYPKLKHLWGFALPSRILPTPREPIALRNTFIDPVLLQSACVKCPSNLSKKLLDKVCFYQQHYKFLSINSFINFFFEGTRKFRITGRAGPSPNYVGEGSDFFISNSKKVLNTRLLRRWHWKVSYSSKLKKLHLQQIESQARHTDSSIA